MKSPRRAKSGPGRPLITNHRIPTTAKDTTAPPRKPSTRFWVLLASRKPDFSSADVLAADAPPELLQVVEQLEVSLPGSLDALQPGMIHAFASDGARRQILTLQRRATGVRGELHDLGPARRRRA